MSSGVTVGEGGEGVEETGLVRMNQGRLPEGGVGQCQAKERAGQGGAGGGRNGSWRWPWGGCWAVCEQNSWVRVGPPKREWGYMAFIFLSPGCGRSSLEQDGVGRQGGGSERVYLRQKRAEREVMAGQVSPEPPPLHTSEGGNVRDLPTQPAPWQPCWGPLWLDLGCVCDSLSPLH